MKNYHPQLYLSYLEFLRSCRLLQEIYEITRPLTKLLEEDTPFIFSQDCLNAFNILKEKLTNTPIMITPDWNLLFKLMCDASDFAVGVVLG